MNPVKFKIQKHIKAFDITTNHIDYCNRCDMLHLAVWYDKSLLERHDNYVVLKNNKNCYVVKEGIFNADTCHLAEPFVALQMYYKLTILQAYVVCDEFMKKAKKNSLRYYCTQVYGEPDIPSVPETSLNYVVDQNILAEEEVAMRTLYGILADVYEIDRKIISKLTELNLITVDPNYNICFNTFDANGNVASVLKLSRYDHNDKTFSFNHYITKRNIGFKYYTSGPETVTTLTVFDSPIELLSYLSLENKPIPLVKKLSDMNCMLALYSSNFDIVNDFLKSHKFEHINDGLKLNQYNFKTNKKYIKIEARRYHVNTEDLSNQINEYIQNNITKLPAEVRIEGWHKLLTTKLSNPIPQPEGLDEIKIIL